VHVRRSAGARDLLEHLPMTRSHAGSGGVELPSAPQMLERGDALPARGTHPAEQDPGRRDLGMRRGHRPPVLVRPGEVAVVEGLEAPKQLLLDPSVRIRVRGEVPGREEVGGRLHERERPTGGRTAHGVQMGPEAAGDVRPGRKGDRVLLLLGRPRFRHDVHVPTQQETYPAPQAGVAEAAMQGAHGEGPGGHRVDGGLDPLVVPHVEEQEVRILAKRVHPKDTDPVGRGAGHAVVEHLDLAPRNAQPCRQRLGELAIDGGVPDDDDPVRSRGRAGRPHLGAEVRRLPREPHAALGVRHRHGSQRVVAEGQHAAPLGLFDDPRVRQGHSERCLAARQHERRGQMRRARPRTDMRYASFRSIHPRRASTPSGPASVETPMMAQSTPGARSPCSGTKVASR
jgi:hypothetical protein